MDFLALVTLTAQLLPIMNESFGGVSGQDSIWRAVAAQMDQSLGGLYLAGIYSIVIPSSSISVRRAGLLHTPQQTSVESIEVALRSKWLNLASQERRRGQLFMWPTTSHNVLDFSPNFSMFIIPYMLDCSPSPVRSVRLTRASLHTTAAHSVARFGIFLASIAIVFAIRASIILLYMEDGVQKYLMLGSEIGRYFMVILQESSIFTYSCGYKCVGSWASPVIYSKWDIQEEERFRSDVVRSMGYAYHAYAMFWLIELMWKGMGLLFPWWKKRIGPRIFSKFSSPSDSEFQDEEMVTIRLRVEEQLEFSANWDQKFVVDFEMPKAFEVARREILIGETWFRWGAICLCGGFAICGVAGPIKFFGDGQPTTGAKIAFALMQLVPWALFYKDIPNQSINCVFASPSSAHSGPISSGSHNVASSSATTVSTVTRRPRMPVASSSKASSSSNAYPIRRDPPRGAAPSVEGPQEVATSPNHELAEDNGDDNMTDVLQVEYQQTPASLISLSSSSNLHRRHSTSQLEVGYQQTPSLSSNLTRPRRHSM
jgi:hypothetical protein